MSGSGFYPILGIGLTDEVLPVHVGLTGVHYGVLLPLWTTAPALIVDFVGLTGALFYRAAGSVHRLNRRTQVFVRQINR